MFEFCTEDSPQSVRLHERLLDFYSNSSDYSAFSEASFHPQFWSSIKQRVQQVIQEKGQCRLLEIGAGRTDIGNFLGELRSNTLVAVQDITAANFDYLSGVADQVYVSEIESIDETFDIIFATYVLEHVTRPRHILDHLLGRLNTGGSLFLLNPRYDFPFYISPSRRNLPRFQQLIIALWLQFKRVSVLLGGLPVFLIDTNPAVFHGPWYRDADAVHWVSLFDIKRHLSGTCSIRTISLGYSGWKAILWERCCLLSVEITPR